MAGDRRLCFSFFQHPLRCRFDESVPRMTARPPARMCNKCGWDRTLRSLGASLVLILLSSFAQPQAALSLQNQKANDYTIHVSVDEVVLRATAQTNKGVLVSGLGKDDFQVYEDGVLQQVRHFSHEDIPVTVGLVMDNSGSMQPKRDTVIAAAMAFARSSNPQDQMFVVNFNEKVALGLPVNRAFTDNVGELETALSRTPATGETALYDAVAVALEHLQRGNRDKKVLIVISDGGDNASKHNLAQIRAMAAHSDVILYTIGIFDEEDADRNPHVLKQLAKDTGGEAFLPKSLKSVPAICEQIARDIRNQYAIGYVPSNKKPDGTYRMIELKAQAAGYKHLIVRTRSGYYALPKNLPVAKNKADAVHK